ncbi:PHP domain-containing protein [Microlunatus sp. Y2014]|uniref:PHP domain-containing protein n=1 Tax=Microlunatus sp. Y2014 TaxID=3418488 RepID=UPI003DA6D783
MSPDPVAALREVGFWLERSRADTHRVKAHRRAADLVEEMSPAERDRHAAKNSWSTVRGLGPKTVAIISQAVAGDVPTYLAEQRAAGAAPLAAGGAELRAALRGDLHVHSTWSDGGSPLAEMMATARALGHEYCAITDHSPRLRVANGLSAERLQEQWAAIEELQAELDGFRVLRGIEVDILDDGGLDQERALLDQLDIVVASVHSNLRADSETMTVRMVTAIANPRTNVLGHCTGRLVTGERGVRPESVFDAEVVFEACRQFDVAVEINSRPERRDPPSRLIELARDTGCLFSIDTDAHAPGQLDFQTYGCERAEAAGIKPERIINTWPVDRLLGWAGAKKTAAAKQAAQKQAARLRAGRRS